MSSRLFSRSFRSVCTPQIFSRSFSSAKPKPTNPVPLIDISPSFSSAAGRQQVAKAFDDAARSIGFFGITGHNIDPKLIKRMTDVTWNYFDLGVEEKARIPMTDKYPYGYSGFGEENLRKGYSNEGTADPKESFAIGPNNPLAGMPPVMFPQNPADMKRTWLEYYGACENLSAHILRLFALALKLPENWFDGKIDKHRSALRALNYPEIKEGKPAFIRAGAHSDYGSITILLQDETGGLQVQNRANEWCDITPVPGAFVINLGDLLARWSNDQWVSTIHRVVNHGSNKRRQSIAFFHNVNADQSIEAIPTCVGPNNPAKYPPIKAWDLLIEKHSASVKNGGKY